MKIQDHQRKILIAICALALAGPQGFTAGPILPPAGPGPIYKTLDEVEPRTPISSLPYTINQCGSYYLTDCLTGTSGQNGITIQANNVTLDLCGFALIGVPGSVDGVNIPINITNVAIRNGTAVGWGGMGFDVDTAWNSQLVDLRASHNGSHGIALGGGGIIRNCTARANGGNGIDARDVSTVSGCTSTGNGNSGISLDNGATVTGCSVSGNTNSGILASSGCSLSDITSYANGGDGIRIGSDCRVVNNACDGNGAGAGTGAGIRATGSDNAIKGNSLTDNDSGLDIDGANNIIANNTVRQNSDNYTIAQGNQLEILLCQIPESIDWPATVVLAGSLTGTSAQNGITVNFNDVAIDLRGHSLIGVSNSLDGIRISGNRLNISVRNGSVQGWGQDGVDAASALNSSVENVNASNNGGRGIALGAGGLVASSNARANQGNGIVISAGCRVTDSSCSENQGIGIDMSSGSTAAGCVAYNNEGIGIDASTGCIVAKCTSYSNTGIGINASDATVVDNCAISNNSTNGIVCGFGAKIRGCAVRANGGNGILVSGGDAYVFNNTVDGHSGDAGILVSSMDNRIDNNNLTDNTRGIEVTSSGNLVIRNSVAGGTQYDIVAGNTVGFIQGVADPISNAIGPWANFSF